MSHEKHVVAVFASMCLRSQEVESQLNLRRVQQLPQHTQTHISRMTHSAGLLLALGASLIAVASTTIVQDCGTFLKLQNFKIYIKRKFSCEV